MSRSRRSARSTRSTRSSRRGAASGPTSTSRRSRCSPASRRLARHLDLARREAFETHGLEPWEFDVLAALRREGAPYALSPGRLLQVTLVTSGTMTNRIDRLEAKGLVERVPDPNDGRGVQVVLTDDRPPPGRRRARPTCSPTSATSSPRSAPPTATSSPTSCAPRSPSTLPPTVPRQRRVHDPCGPWHVEASARRSAVGDDAGPRGPSRAASRRARRTARRTTGRAAPMGPPLTRGRPVSSHTARHSGSSSSRPGS